MANGALRSSLMQDADAILRTLGVPRSSYTDGGLSVRSPISGEVIARLPETSPAEAAAVIERAHAAFLAWRRVPAPRRGELVRLVGEALRAVKDDLGRLVTIETGKIVSEGRGE